MDIENTLKEMAERHPEIKGARELIQMDIDQWEETDHFNIKYQREMVDDSKSDIDLYVDIKSQFWEGFLYGKQEIGKDIYGIASELVKGR